jgi:ribosome-binding factor A
MSIRTERVASVIKEDLSKILQGYQRGNMITITSVNMTPDLSIARVNLSIMDPGGNEYLVFEHLTEKIPAIRGELAKLIRHQVRKIPEIQLFTDDTAEYTQKLEKLFRAAKAKESDQPNQELED